MSKESVKRTNISMKPEIDALLRSLSKKTGLKMATVIEKGILMFEKYTKTHDS
jgi:predicted DNA-binding protein